MSCRRLGAENDLGSIEVGKYADMILLDQNLFDIEAEQINDIQVLQTILGGKIVYDRSKQGGEDIEGLDDVPHRMTH